MRSFLSWAGWTSAPGLQTRDATGTGPPRTIGYASVKIMQATLRTRAGNGSYFCFRKMRKNLKDNSYWQTG
jgi:hypothetical protein